MKKAILLIPLVALLGGCKTHSDLMPFLGKWAGGFKVKTIDGGGSDKDRVREQLNGFIQVYATKQSYKMELNGEQETIQIAGTWTMKGNRIILTPKSLIIDDKGGADQRDPNKKYISATEVQAAYNRPLILTESSNKKSLQGLEISVGHLVGSHVFIKDSF